jgi:hypothetical protein
MSTTTTSHHHPLQFEDFKSVMAMTDTYCTAEEFLVSSCTSWASRGHSVRTRSHYSSPLSSRMRLLLFCARFD